MRVNFEVNDALNELIEDLQEKTESTKKGVIVGALLLLKWSLEQAGRGRIIAAIDPDDLPERVHQYDSALTSMVRAEHVELSRWNERVEDEADAAKQLLTSKP